jgi:hypothetical protein
MPSKRVRHHTNDQGLEGIKRIEAIVPARADTPFEAGVHVEVEPFGSTRPDHHLGPKAELGCAAEGAYVEFDAPPILIPRYIGRRNSAMIPTGINEPFSLRGLSPVYVKVRFKFWEFWRQAWE